MKITFSILICCLFVSFSIYPTAAQSVRADEFSETGVKNEEYEKTPPKPSNLPPPLHAAWSETSTDGESLYIASFHANNEAVVYTDKDTNEYHLGSCQYYAEKSGGDYSRPRWLSEVVLDGTRCTLCVPDGLYFAQKEAVLRTKINRLEFEINLFVNIFRGLTILLTVCITAALLRHWKKRKPSQNVGF